MSKVIVGHVLNPGCARGQVQVLQQRLSFWGGFDPKQGTVIDRHHPQYGCEIAGKIVVLPGSRGSAGTPAGVAESVRLEKGPIGMVLGCVDINLAIGFMVSARLYKSEVPVVAVTDVKCYQKLVTGEVWSISQQGVIECKDNP